MPSSLYCLESGNPEKIMVSSRKENIWLNGMQAIVGVGCAQYLKLNAAMI